MGINKKQPIQKPRKEDERKFKEMTKQRELAQQRKSAIKELTSKFGFDSRAVRKMHEVY